MRPIACILGAHTEGRKTEIVRSPGVNLVGIDRTYCTRCGWVVRGIGYNASWVAS